MPLQASIFAPVIKLLESKYFLGLSDPVYLQFNKKLVASAYPMEGVRLPDIRKTAKTIAADTDALPPFILRKSISKSLESFRLTPEQKDRLRQLRQASL